MNSVSNIGCQWLRPAYACNFTIIQLCIFNFNLSLDVQLTLIQEQCIIGYAPFSVHTMRMKSGAINNLNPLWLILVSQQPTEYSMLCIWRCDIKQTHQNRKKRNKWFLTSFSSLSNIHTYIPHNGVEQILMNHSYSFVLRVSCYVSRLIQACFCKNILWKLEYILENKNTPSKIISTHWVMCTMTYQPCFVDEKLTRWIHNLNICILLQKT